MCSCICVAVAPIVLAFFSTALASLTVSAKFRMEAAMESSCSFTFLAAGDLRSASGRGRETRAQRWVFGRNAEERFFTPEEIRELLELAKMPAAWTTETCVCGKMKKT